MRCGSPIPSLHCGGSGLPSPVMVHHTFQEMSNGVATIQGGTMVQPEAFFHKNECGERVRYIDIKVQRDWHQIFFET